MEREYEGESPTPRPPPHCGGEGRPHPVRLPLSTAVGRGPGGWGLLSYHRSELQAELQAGSAMMDEDRGAPGRRLWGRDASRDLRRRATPTERRLWERLRDHRLGGK